MIRRRLGNLLRVVTLLTLISQGLLKDQTRNIMGYKLAKLGEFNFMVRIDFPDGSVCGGVIITPSWVISIMRCFAGVMDILLGLFDYLESVTVHAGTVQLHTHGQQTSTVEKVIRHHRHKEQNKYWKKKGIPYTFDIALVKLKNPFEMNEVVGAVNMADMDSWPNNYQQECTFIGWGPTHLTKIRRDNGLAYYDVVASHLKYCFDVIHGGLGRSMLCKTQDTPGSMCLGDVGGALYCNDKALIGIGSGMNHTKENKPEERCLRLKQTHNIFVYQYVAYYRQLMEDNIEDLPPSDSLEEFRSSAGRTGLVYWFIVTSAALLYASSTV